jgi:mannosyltransferase
VKSRRCATALVVVVLVVAVVLRVALSLRTGIWADEVFSLAVATGHSIEHPAALAEPAYGDYVEADDALPAASWQVYLELGESPAGPRRVVRAVFLSDSNPPLYYLLLNGWARVAGTGDGALRLFSVFWALASLPLVFLVGREIGGRRVALIAVLLFSLSPVALHYSTEVRMYSLGWVLGLAMALASLRMHRHGYRPVPLLLFTLAAAAALLTHYFLAFVWLACLAWLVLHPGKLSRRYLAIATAIAVLLVLPWYRHLPESIGAWRVSAGWLDHPLSLRQAVVAPFRRAWGLLSGHGSWGGSITLDLLLALLYAGLIAFVLVRGIAAVLRTPMQLPWFWLLGSILGVLAFDLVQGTSALLVSRYAVLGLPAALLLAAVAIDRLPGRAAATFATIVILVWSSGIRDSFSPLARPHQPFPEIAASLVSGEDRPDAVIVHSIPTGVLGVARYLPPEVPVASWVVQLGGRRIPEDLSRLLHGRCRIALVKVHDLGELSPAEAWLRTNTALEYSTGWQTERGWTVAEAHHFRIAGNDAAHGGDCK